MNHSCKNCHSICGHFSRFPRVTLVGLRIIKNVSGKLPTHPSPKPTLTLTYHLGHCGQFELTSDFSFFKTLQVPDSYHKQ